MHSCGPALVRGLVEQRQPGLFHILDDSLTLQLGMGVERFNGEPDYVTDVRAGRDRAVVTEGPMMHQNARSGIWSLMDLHDLVGIHHQRLPVGGDGWQSGGVRHGGQPGIDDDWTNCDTRGHLRRLDIVRVEGWRTRWIDPEIGKKVWLLVCRDLHPALDDLFPRLAGDPQP